MAAPGVTIIDIARALGISKTAVSSALHGSGRVSDATRARVLAQADAMGYVSNRAAQRLRGGRHGAIGLHIPTDVRDLAFYMEFAFGAAAAAAIAGLDLLLLADGAAGRGRRPAIDGLLAIDPTPATLPSVLAGIDESTPVVAIGEYEGPEQQRIAAWIAADHGRLVRELLDRLERDGSTAPALIALQADREPMWAQRVTDGYRVWCAEHRLEPVVVRRSVSPSDDEIVEAIATARVARADAAIWVAQGLALRARALQGAGVGGSSGAGAHAGVGGDADAASAAPAPGLVMATMAVEPSGADLLGVDLRAREYGRAAADLLVRVLDGDAAAGEHVVHEAGVVG